MRSLSIFTLAMINVAAICSIKNWPITAEYGFSSLFYFILAALLFFIPASFVSAELATGWPERGGVYVWVREAMGHRAGFLAIWLQWIENVVWYPTILSFIGGTIAYAFMPELANNKTYMLIVILISFWGVTLLNLRGMKTSGFMSSFGVIFGTIIPGIIIISLGLLWWTSGKPIHIDMSWKSLVPTLGRPHELALLAGVLLGLAGMEMSAVHAKDVINPQRNYPKAIFLSALIIIVLSVLGTLAIAFVIPKENISFVAGSMEAIATFFRAYGFGWAVPIFAILIAIGALGGVSTWAAGPSKGLLAAAQDGDFPPILHKINKNDMPVAMLVFQGIIISFLSLVFLLMPDVNSSFWILLVLASQLYLIMYVMLFVSAIILRYTHPKKKRTYKIPLGNIGMWIVSSIGIFGSAGAFLLGFYPPDQVTTGNYTTFITFLIVGIVVMCAAPFVILMFKKPSWNEY